MSMNPELCASAQDQRHDADKDRSVRGLESEQASIWWPSLSTLPQRSLSWPAIRLLQLAIRNDEELNKLLHGVTIA